MRGVRTIGSVLVALAMMAGPAAGEPAAGDASDEIRTLRETVQRQQQAIDQLSRAVDDLAARQTSSAPPAAQDAMGGPPGPSAEVQLEDRTARLERMVGNLDVGGWMDFRAGDSTQDGKSTFFDPHHLYLYFDSRVGERWQAFAEVEFEHAPAFEAGGGVGEIKLERAYLDYHHSKHVNARVGKFNTPWGYWTPVHWAILVDTVQKPIHEDNSYVPRKQVGAQIFGRTAERTVADLPVSFRYRAWYSNGSELSGTNQLRDSDPGYGFDLRSIFGEHGQLLGVSGYLQQNPSFGGRQERSLMVYTDLHPLEDLTLRGEVMAQQRSRGFPTRYVGYAKVRWDLFDGGYVNYRYGRGDDDKRGAGDRHTENVFTLGYSPIPNVRLKAEFALNDFAARSVEDFSQWSLYAGFFF